MPRNEHQNPQGSRSSKPSSGNRTQSGSGYTRIEWLNVSLSKDDKKRLSETPYDPTVVAEFLAFAVELGYKVVLSPLNDNGFCGATLFGHGANCPNKGWGVSGEGGSIERALLSLMFKCSGADLATDWSGDGETDFDFR